METKPVACVMVVVLKDDEVLLVENLAGSDQVTGIFGLPAGRLEEGEDFVTGGVRELEEESGLLADKEDMLLLPTQYTADIGRKDGSFVRMTAQAFWCKKYIGDIRTTSETRPVWIKISELDRLKLVVNVKNAVLEAVKAFHSF